MCNILSITKLFVIVNTFRLVSGIDSRSTSLSSSPNGLDCELSYGSLDGSNVRIGLIHTNVQAETTTLAHKVKAVLKVCGNVDPDNMFEEIVSKEFDFPITAKFLSMSEYVDAIIIIADANSHLTTSNDATSIATMQGIMDIQLRNYVPIVFRSVSRNSYNSSPETSSYEIAKTAVEMALTRWETFVELAEFGQSGTGFTAFTAFLIILLFILLLVGFIMKKRGITIDKSIFAKAMCCVKQYDKVQVATPVTAEIA